MEQRAQEQVPSAPDESVASLSRRGDATMRPGMNGHGKEVAQPHTLGSTNTITNGGLGSHEVSAPGPSNTARSPKDSSERQDHTHEEVRRRPKPVKLRDRFAAKRQKDQSVASVLAQQEKGLETPGQIVSLVFAQPNAFKRSILRWTIRHELYKGRGLGHPTAQEQEEAYRRGRFLRDSPRPSSLFLQILSDVYLTLDRSPLAGLCSPDIIASTGVVPVTIISIIPDIMEHYANAIVSAEREVLLATNYWQMGTSTKKIGQALRDLDSKLASQEKPFEKAVVKIIWDRGPANLHDVLFFRRLVDPDQWPSQGLPHPKEVPNLDIKVLNFHKTIMGTFHTKMLIIDHKIALLNSNNIQDRPNLEMMSQFEGDIVNAFYDVFLVSWKIALRPSLPCLEPASDALRDFEFGDSNQAVPTLDKAHLSDIIDRTRRRLKGENAPSDEEPRPKGFAEIVQSVMAKAKKSEGSPGLGHTTPNEATSSETSRKTEHVRDGKSGGGRLSEAARNVMAVLRDEKGGKSTASSSLINRIKQNRAQRSSSSADSDAVRIKELNQVLSFANNKETAATAEALDGDFEPFILHKAHRPVPMALVNRAPHGMPGHLDIRNPQDASWLAGMRYAQKEVFIQTPTFNAKPMVRAVLAACRREIVVIIYAGLGFNDKGEAMPFQGGTNEEVTERMYRDLRRTGHEHFLKVYWYVGKDQTRVLNAIHKQRNCHIKFMNIDGQVTIYGNGNQDTQSWFHSQEVNIMVDSSDLSSDWLQALNKNQNTAQYGLVSSSDGKWRDAQGKLLVRSGR